MMHFVPTAHREGAKHKAVVASIHVKWKPWLLTPKHKAAKVQTEQIIMDMKEQEPPIRLLSFQCAVAEKVRDVQDMEKIGPLLVGEHYPQKLAKQKTPYWQHPEKTEVTYHKWDAYRLLKQYKAKNLTNILKAWKYYTVFKQLEKKSQEVSRKLRKQRLLEDLQSAMEAAHNLDVRALYQIINKLAPKNQYKTVRPRNKNGSQRWKPPVLSSTSTTASTRRMKQNSPCISNSGP